MSDHFVLSDQPSSAVVPPRTDSPAGGGTARATRLVGGVSMLAVGLLALSGCAFLKGENSVMSLEVNDCFVEPTELEEVTSIKKTDCSEEHNNEVYHLITLSDEEGLPATDDEWLDYDFQCVEEAFEEYTGEDYFTSPNWDHYTMRPTEESFANGDNEIVCVLYDMEERSWSGTPRDGEVSYS